MNNSKGEFVFAEVPLLFENNFQNKFDCVIVILRDLETRIASIMQRNSISRAECIKRISSQFDYDKANNENAFPKNCIFLQNDASEKELKKKIHSIIETVKHIS